MNFLWPFIIFVYPVGESVPIPGAQVCTVKIFKPRSGLWFPCQTAEKFRVAGEMSVRSDRLGIVTS